MKLKIDETTGTLIVFLLIAALFFAMMKFVLPKMGIDT